MTFNQIQDADKHMDWSGFWTYTLRTYQFPWEVVITSPNPVRYRWLGEKRETVVFEYGNGSIEYYTGVGAVYEKFNGGLLHTGRKDRAKLLAELELASLP